MMDILNKLAQSRFRSRFHLSEKDYLYIQQKGIQTIAQHASDFISQRLAPENIPNDGKQTPMRGHPVFIAQHATATCCRKCLQKWHKIPQNKPLSEQQQIYIVHVIMSWIEKEFNKLSK